ncbi:heavy metal translocating P-type ATPase [Salinispira pacifica]|uniref:P-type Zn(2+) transporter n=1 Tax=Salinispira pacifica TaxID=1307761 RepID=V5WFV5_9SPIO|nr:cation-translocating P-type ATPase [Salinispira pacifica]AHC14449.1 Lead, cadmium, zinc and mercury transporting ATPase/ Copper-translocating P-type ATPase [Salinispira pacifica]
MRILQISKIQRLVLSAALITLAFAVRELWQLQLVFAWFMMAAGISAGYPIFTKAFSALRYKILGIDALVTIAVIGAVIIGEYWEAAAVTFLFSLGDYLESRSIEKTRSSIKALLDLAPVTARVLRDGQEQVMSAEGVEQNDLIVVKPGEKVSVDGIVTQGYGALNQAAITGEPLPVEAQSGSEVFSGSILESGYLIIRARRVGEETTFARILHMVEDAQDKKAQTQKFLEKFSRYYTPGIIVLAVILFVLTRDVTLALTLLVIACPGALVISTPVSIVAGIGTGARRGILIKGGDIMERLGTVKAVALDKTGTLTQGRPRVSELITLGGHDPDELMRIAATGETYSEHPLGTAVVNYAETRFGVTGLRKPDESRIIPGQGIEFSLQGDRYFIGNRRLFADMEITLDGETEARLAAQEQLGRTGVLVGTPRGFLGIIAIEDSLRQGVQELVQELRNQGVRHIAMLTGDGVRTARAVAGSLGLDSVHSGLLPEDKVRVLKELQDRYGQTAMVGDGVNDAPALAAADLGIALGGAGKDIAMETADVVLLSSRIQKLSTALSLSRATLRNVKQNIIFALGVAGVLLAGVLIKTVNLSFGMLIHELSVLLVILNALRLMYFKPPGNRGRFLSRWLANLSWRKRGRKKPGIEVV